MEGASVTHFISFSTAQAKASDQLFRGKASHAALMVSLCTYSLNLPALSKSLVIHQLLSSVENRGRASLRSEDDHLPIERDVSALDPNILM
jgi:hypothetical protein